ncbi:MAG: hypothetical protein AAFV72_00125 [Cyanobacteria bacterium J06635_1]
MTIQLITAPPLRQSRSPQAQTRLALYRQLRRRIPAKVASIAATAIARQQHQGIGPNRREKKAVRWARKFLKDVA